MGVRAGPSARGTALLAPGSPRDLFPKRKVDVVNGIQRILVSVVTVGVVAGAALAEEPVEPGRRRATLLGGVGNTMGWLGIQGEVYALGDRASLVGGLGAVVGDSDAGDLPGAPAPDGATYAIAARLFTGGTNHRAFLEASYSQVAWRASGSHAGGWRHDRLYGPGAQLGYQYVADGGFTALASGGVGYGRTDAGSDHADILLGFGLGYTWR